MNNGDGGLDRLSISQSDGEREEGAKVDGKKWSVLGCRFIVVRCLGIFSLLDEIRSGNVRSELEIFTRH